MKSPTDISGRLARQWDDANTREYRLLQAEAWPLRITIGKPTAIQLTGHFQLVRQHVEQWRDVTVGDVEWEAIKYRGTAEAIELPLIWQLNSPSEWVEATADSRIQSEYQRLSKLVAGTDPIFHHLLVRRRHLPREREIDEVIRAGKLSHQLTSGCAKGLPLRALSLESNDSKFFERNRAIIVAMLDVRFDGVVSDVGLEAFLGALDERDHWLLISDLDGSLLPFAQQRVRDKELVGVPLPSRHILLVENEQCLHQLPEAKDTIAILGAGLNLEWLAAPWLAEKDIGYWGDIDTWGLSMLARARTLHHGVTPLLMTEEVYLRHCKKLAVPEPVPAGHKAPPGLTETETTLYNRLCRSEKGRLEQEFLPREEVVQSVLGWLNE